ncbi:hypothetical protein HPB50_004789 [Hyalomma asiaticum]|uniref:Uncharacterized protein n=1 Tax=Hyalomma asiaticum TaxID=266040 RepID=A0ACB7SKQ9_HYAAI|nr:hypothetical protein HPB50_004789 [Hyalomma asiaticum]
MNGPQTARVSADTHVPQLDLTGTDAAVDLDDAPFVTPSERSVEHEPLAAAEARTAYMGGLGDTTSLSLDAR